MNKGAVSIKRDSSLSRWNHHGCWWLARKSFYL